MYSLKLSYDSFCYWILFKPNSSQNNINLPNHIVLNFDNLILIDQPQKFILIYHFW
jgi:hypothetical protein